MNTHSALETMIRLQPGKSISIAQDSVICFSGAVVMSVTEMTNDSITLAKQNVVLSKDEGVEKSYVFPIAGGSKTIGFEDISNKYLSSK